MAAPLVVEPEVEPAPPTPQGEPGPGWAAVSGVVAAGVALGVGELVTGSSGAGPTLVTAIGSEFIDRYAASLKDLAIRLFGTNDKVALVTGIVVVSLVLGALLGWASRRRRWVGPVGFASFGLVGLLAYLGDPQGDTTTGVVASVLAVLAGTVTLLALLRLAPVSPSDGAAGSPSRRRFLVTTGVLAVGAAGAAALGRRVRASDVVDTARRQTVLPRVRTSTPLPAPSVPAIPGLTPYVTPNPDFYRIDTALVVPEVDVASWDLGVRGLVDRPLRLTYDELVAMSTTEDVVTLQCVSNEVGGYLVGNAVWQGVSLAALLERAGVQPGATQIVGRSVDGFTAGFPTEIGLDGRTALVAVGMNGEPLPASHGFPARLIVAGLYGYVSATKWLREIELTTWEDFDGYWVPRGWAKEGPIKVASRIDVPPGGDQLPSGRVAIAGVAWAPTLGVERVEVQIDDDEWQDATLGEAASGNTWVQWYLDWDATPGEHRIRARATDRGGLAQTEERAPPAPDGATGWHTRRVDVRA